MPGARPAPWLIAAALALARLAPAPPNAARDVPLASSWVTQRDVRYMTRIVRCTAAPQIGGTWL